MRYLSFLPNETRLLSTPPVGETSPNENSSLSLNDPVGDNMSIPARRIAPSNNWVGLEESSPLIMLPSQLEKKNKLRQRENCEVAHLVTVNTSEIFRMPKKST